MALFLEFRFEYVFEENGDFSKTIVEEQTIKSESVKRSISINAGNEHQQLNCSGDIRVKLLDDISQIGMAPVGAYESKIIISMVAE